MAIQLTPGPMHVVAQLMALFRAQVAALAWMLAHMLPGVPRIVTLKTAQLAGHIPGRGMAGGLRDEDKHVAGWRPRPGARRQLLSQQRAAEKQQHADQSGHKSQAHDVGAGRGMGDGAGQRAAMMPQYVDEMRPWRARIRLQFVTTCSKTPMPGMNV